MKRKREGGSDPSRPSGDANEGDDLSSKPGPLKLFKAEDTIDGTKEDLAKISDSLREYYRSSSYHEARDPEIRINAEKIMEATDMSASRFEDPNFWQRLYYQSWPVINGNEEGKPPTLPIEVDWKVMTLRRFRLEAKSSLSEGKRIWQQLEKKRQELIDTGSTIIHKAHISYVQRSRPLKRGRDKRQKQRGIARNSKIATTGDNKEEKEKEEEKEEQEEHYMEVLCRPQRCTLTGGPTAQNLLALLDYATESLQTSKGAQMLKEQARSLLHPDEEEEEEKNEKEKEKEKEEKEKEEEKVEKEEDRYLLALIDNCCYKNYQAKWRRADYYVEESVHCKVSLYGLLSGLEVMIFFEYTRCGAYDSASDNYYMSYKVHNKPAKFLCLASCPDDLEPDPQAWAVVVSLLVGDLPVDKDALWRTIVHGLCSDPQLDQ